LKPLFQFKFEILLDTHAYIKHLWQMTADYLNAAIEVFNELQTLRTQNTIASLQLVMAIGAMAGLVAIMGTKISPKLTSFGAVYIVILLAMAWVLNFSISTLYKNRKYTIKSEIEKKIE
jgi:pentose-5-phosphate-3-epimerase